MPEDPHSTDDRTTVAILIDDPRWSARHGPGLEERVRFLVRHALSATALPADGSPLEVSVALTDDAMMRDLNRRYRGQDRPTNVLSFAFEDFPGPEVDDLDSRVLLGDVVLAYETVEREADSRGCRPDDHLAHLVIHGALHLAGFDHQTDTDAARMERLEIDLLAAIGIASPYDTDGILPSNQLQRDTAQ